MGHSDLFPIHAFHLPLHWIINNAGYNNYIARTSRPDQGDSKQKGKLETDKTDTNYALGTLDTPRKRVLRNIDLILPMASIALVLIEDDSNILYCIKRYPRPSDTIWLHPIIQVVYHGLPQVISTNPIIPTHDST